MARALSALAIMTVDSIPTYLRRRCLSMVRICSNRIIEFLSKPSKSLIKVCVGNFALVCIRLVMGATMTVGLLFSLFSTTIVSQFTTGNTEMIHIGASSLRVNGITFMLFGYYTVYSSLFLALGKGKEGFILGACRQGICFIPVILIFPFIWGLNGILYAQPIADVLSALITVFMAIPLHRSLAVAEQKMKITASIPCDRQ